MSEWYCNVGGTRYGPVSQEQVLSWIAEGRVKPDDLVWHEGMAEWAPASAVPGLFPPGYGPVGPPALGAVPRPAGGTGGQTPNAELMTQARTLLAGRWGLPIGFCLLLALLSMAVQMLPYIGAIAALIVQGPLTLGGVIFFLTFTRGGNAELGMLFAGFKNFGNALAAYLLMAIFVFLWMLLLIVPGIIAALAYSQTMYLLADNPQLGGLGAIRKSKEMMRGYKWKFFCLGLRFLGWYLLCILTLGIGYLWLMPYMSGAYARFYDDLQPAAAGTPGPDALGLAGGPATAGTDLPTAR